MLTANTASLSSEKLTEGQEPLLEMEKVLSQMPSAAEGAVYPRA